MLKYHCRILFTIRNQYENHVLLEEGEWNPDTLLKLVGKLYPEAENKQDEIRQIVELLHGHTFAADLAVRMLAKTRGIHTKPKRNTSNASQFRQCYLNSYRHPIWVAVLIYCKYFFLRRLSRAYHLIVLEIRPTIPVRPGLIDMPASLREL